MKKLRRDSSRKKKGSRSSSNKGVSNPKPSLLEAPEKETEESQIQSLINLLKRNKLTELEWESNGFRVRLRDEGESYPQSKPAELNALPRPDLPAKHESQPSSNTTDTSGMLTITSPIVGTFYRSPSPEADPYVEEQDMVKKGQVLCIVEAMKLMNEIESEVDGRVVKILVESSKPVEYGQPLFLIDPTPGN